MGLFVDDLEPKDYRKLKSEILKMYFNNRRATYSQHTRIDVDGCLHEAGPDNMAILLTVEEFINKKFEEIKKK